MKCRGVSVNAVTTIKATRLGANDLFVELLNKHTPQATQKTENSSGDWASGTLEKKRIIQKVLFPDGVLYDGKNHTVLTGKTIFFVALTRLISEYYSGNKNGHSQFNLENALSVAGSGVEPETFGL